MPIDKAVLETFLQEHGATKGEEIEPSLTRWYLEDHFLIDIAMPEKRVNWVQLTVDLQSSEPNDYILSAKIAHKHEILSWGIERPNFSCRAFETDKFETIYGAVIAARDEFYQVKEEINSEKND